MTGLRGVRLLLRPGRERGRCAVVQTIHDGRSAAFPAGGGTPPATVMSMPFTAGETRTTAVTPVARAGWSALAIPGTLGLLAIPALVLESPPLPLVALTFLGFPLVVLAGEDALATGLLPPALLWAPLVIAIWWTAGRRAARATAREPTGFAWPRWRRNFAILALVVLIWQTLGAFVLSAVVMMAATSAFIGIPVLAVVIAAGLWFVWSRRTPRRGPGPVGRLADLEQRKQCPRCGEFIRTETATCEWCSAALPDDWHRTMP